MEVKKEEEVENKVKELWKGFKFKVIFLLSFYVEGLLKVEVKKILLIWFIFFKLIIVWRVSLYEVEYDGFKFLVVWVRNGDNIFKDEVRKLVNRCFKSSNSWESGVGMVKFSIGFVSKDDLIM